MANVAKLKHSVATGNAPAALETGEIAVNIADRKVWVGDATKVPQLLIDSAPFYRGTTAAGVLTKVDGTVAVTRVSIGVFNIITSANAGLIVNLPDGYIWGEQTGAPAGSRRIVVRHNAVIGQPAKDPDFLLVVTAI